MRSGAWLLSLTSCLGAVGCGSNGNGDPLRSSSGGGAAPIGSSGASAKGGVDGTTSGGSGSIASGGSGGASPSMGGNPAGGAPIANGGAGGTLTQAGAAGAAGSGQAGAPALPTGTPRFVGMGTGGRRSLSTDGVHWVDVSDQFRAPSAAVDPDDKWNIRGGCFGAGVFIATVDGAALNSILLSTDGLAWQKVADGKGSGASCAYGSGTFLTAHGSVSSDGGHTWSDASDQINATSGVRPVAMAFAPSGADGVFVSVGEGGVRHRSTDKGLNWIDAFAGGSDLTSVAFGNGKFVAAGSTTKRESSDLGHTWSDETQWDFGDVAYLPDCTAAHAGCFVAISGTRLALQIDGQTDWTNTVISLAGNGGEVPFGLSIIRPFAVGFVPGPSAPVPAIVAPQGLSTDLGNVWMSSSAPMPALNHATDDYYSISHIIYGAP